MKAKSLVLYVDGSGADPNGIAGCAWLREDSAQTGVEWGRGWTNNEAEYRAILAAVKALPRKSEATICCDSSLVVHQLKGDYRILDVRLWDLESEIQTLIQNHFLKITWRWIPRQQNKADRLLRRKPATVPEMNSSEPERKRTHRKVQKRSTNVRRQGATQNSVSVTPEIEVQ